MDRLMSMKVFERVADEGSFAGAARALDLSPPVVTRLVADLEQHLGTRLLQRSTRRLALTEAGQAYLARVRNILQDLAEADAVARADTEEMAGVLRVHVPPVLATYVLGPLVAAFHARHPKVRLEVDVANLDEPPIEDFDVTLIGTSASFDANVVARKVIDSQAILVASPAYARARGLPQSPQDLARHSSLKLRAPFTGARSWRLWCPARADDAVEVAVEPVLVANHTEILLRAAIDGAGITSAPMDLVAPYLTRGELVRVLSPWITGELALYAALPSRKFVPRRTRAFIDFLVEETRAQRDLALQACEGCTN